MRLKQAHEKFFGGFWIHESDFFGGILKEVLVEGGRP